MDEGYVILGMHVRSNHSGQSTVGALHRPLHHERELHEGRRARRRLHGLAACLLPLPWPSPLSTTVRPRLRLVGLHRGPMLRRVPLRTYASRRHGLLDALAKPAAKAPAKAAPKAPKEIKKDETVAPPAEKPAPAPRVAKRTMHCLLYSCN